MPASVDNPITHGGTNRQYKLCRCSDCGVEEFCTPSNDFYVRGKAGDQLSLVDTADRLLVCEACVMVRPTAVR
jgi:hypothetical protein